MQCDVCESTAWAEILVGDKRVPLCTEHVQGGDRVATMLNGNAAMGHVHASAGQEPTVIAWRGGPAFRFLHQPSQKRRRPL